MRHVLRQQRLKVSSTVGMAPDRQCSDRCAVVGLASSYEVYSLWLGGTFLEEKLPRQLDGSFHGLGACSMSVGVTGSRI